MKKQKLNRRQALNLSLGATAGLFTAGFTNKTSSGPECQETPEQVFGPFYPLHDQDDEDVDLTMIKGHTEQAKGEVIFVRGKVTDQNCNPIEGALVEIWQANHHGRYHHERDTSKAELDPNFQGWGEMLTKADGSYSFKTIKPGSYGMFDSASADEDFRTPHIHYKVSLRGYHEVITQMYFEGERLNKTDLVILELPEEERAQFIISPGEPALEKDKRIPVYHFNVVLKQVKRNKKDVLAGIPGKYELTQKNQKTEIMNIRKEDQQLFLDIPNYTTVELKPNGKDRFSAEPIGMEYVFNRDGKGTVSHLTVHRFSSKAKVGSAKKIG